MADDNYDAYDYQDLPEPVAVGENYDAYDLQNAPVGMEADDNQTQAEIDRLIRQNGGEPGSGIGNISPGSNVPDTPDDGGGMSALEKIASSLGLKKPDGSYDWGKILALGGVAAGTVGAMTQTPQRAMTMAELKAGMPASNTPPMWTEEQLAFGRRPMQTGSALERVYAADMQSPVTPGKTYAEGGGVEIEIETGGEPQGALSQAFSGGVRGADGGQSDLIDIKVSGGEYVMDADSVSMLGDGNTEAGIAKLDELREQLRAQKRAAPTSEIPPQAQGPLSYIRGAQ
jgi:hypothetical protein